MYDWVKFGMNEAHRLYKSYHYSKGRIGVVYVNGDAVRT